MCHEVEDVEYESDVYWEYVSEIRNQELAILIDIQHNNKK